MSDEMVSAPEAAKNWRPLSSIQRRVLGVLAEKAKTTPDAYPMTLNALTNGCNQKSNRSPLMNLSADDVEQTLEELRAMTAVAEVQSGGRVPKYRHYLYEWLGVDKVELAVMTELLLRGEQTLGELRGRAARMEPIADLQALHPVIQSLIDKQLVVELTSPGRGQVITHNLYSDKRMEELREQYAAGKAPPTRAASPSAAASVSLEEFEALKTTVNELSEEVKTLKDAVQQLKG
jgi:uncharacterized protein YceH (UPF0502 family)